MASTRGSHKTRLKPEDTHVQGTCSLLAAARCSADRDPSREDQIRVNVIPQKIKDGENSALTTPLSVTGTAEELDNELPSSLVSFVSAHLRLKNTLENAQAEMDVAAKAAKAEAAGKKTLGKKEAPRTDSNVKVEAAKPAEPVKPEPPRTASLFDMPEPVTLPPTSVTQSSAEAEILAEVNEDSAEEEEDWDEAA